MLSRGDPAPVPGSRLPWVQKQPRSPWLIIHFHGGGFVAQTSRSHEVQNTVLLLDCCYVFNYSSNQVQMISLVSSAARSSELSSELVEGAECPDPLRRLLSVT